MKKFLNPEFLNFARLCISGFGLQSQQESVLTTLPANGFTAASSVYFGYTGAVEVSQVKHYPHQSKNHPTHQIE